MKTALYTIEGPPIVQQRPRRGKYGNFYDPNKREKEMLGLELLNQRVRNGFGVLGADLAVYVNVYGLKKGDLDNVLKGLLDAGNGILYQDDRQVKEIHAWRMDVNAKPKTELELEWE